METYIVVFERAKHLDLAEDSLGRDDRLKHVGHLLESDTLARSRISHRPDHSERSVTNHLVGLGLGLLLLLLLLTTLRLLLLLLCLLLLLDTLLRVVTLIGIDRR